MPERGKEGGLLSEKLKTRNYHPSTDGGYPLLLPKVEADEIFYYFGSKT